MPTLAPPPTVQDVEPAELRFRFGTGRLCLDFLATVGERWRRNFDRLRSPVDLGQWIYEGRLLEGRPATTIADLEDARRLRWAVYRLVMGAMGAGEASTEDVATLNEFARRPTLSPQLVDAGGGRRWISDNPVGAVLAAVARDAVDLLASGDRRRLKECAADDCSGLFYDTSRPRSRRWCSMDRCGNRAKTSAYRHRRTRARTP